MTDTFPTPSLREAAEAVSKLLKERGETVAIAETAAGGLISASLLAMPGASKVYKGGLTLYTLEARIEYAGWTQRDIDAYAGPTPDLVAGLADNTRSKLKATYVLCESGTAGPTASGKTPNRQPGYVALAVSTDNGTFRTDRETGSKNREENMVNFAVAGLGFLREVIEGKAKL